MEEARRHDSSAIQDELLGERLLEPVVPADRLSGFRNHYKIKLRSSGYRMVYEVVESKITVYVIAVGKRDDFEVYKKASKRRRDSGGDPA